MLLFANKARSTLTGSVTSAAGQVATITTGDGTKFVGVGGVATSATNPMRCVLTAVDGGGNDNGAFEVVELTRSSDSLTLVSRGLEGTTAAAWPIGTVVDCRPTAASLTTATLDMRRFVSAPVILSGYYYTGETYMTALQNFVAGVVGIEAVPFLVDKDRSFDRIGVLVNTAMAAGKHFTLGIYEADPATGLPGALVTQTASTLADTTGTKEITIAVNLLGGRMYWLVINSEATVNYAGAAYARPALGYPSIGGSYGACSIQASPAYASLVTDATTYTWSLKYGGTYPYIYLRAV